MVTLDPIEIELLVVRRTDFLKYYFSGDSAGGIFVPGSPELVTGSKVKIRVRFQENNTHFNILGVVRWRRLAGNHRLEQGVGVELEASEWETRDLILDYARGREIRWTDREDERVSVSVKIDYRLDSVALTDIATDLSRGGLFLKTTQKFEVGTTIPMKLRLPGMFFAVKVDAAVAWVKEQGNSQGIGVEFLYPNLRTQKKIQKFLERAYERETIRISK